MVILLGRPESSVVFYKMASTRLYYRLLMNINSMQVELIQLLSPI